MHMYIHIYIYINISTLCRFSMTSLEQSLDMMIAIHERVLPDGAQHGAMVLNHPQRKDTLSPAQSCATNPIPSQLL